jgi:thiamine pyrophosphate-dependent acetolactate synthase large subunit-like protein
VRVADAVGRALAELGVRHAFGLIGSGNFAVSNALVAAGARFVASRHEGGAITMADAYARASGRVGLCSVHQGPGLTNAMTGLAEAAKSRTPLLVLAADTAAAAVRSNFRIDQDGLVAAVGAVAERLHGPATAVADAARAYRRAQVERRPVVLMMPLDVQAAACPAGAGLPPAPPPLGPVRPAARATEDAAAALAGASRPLILAGRGAVLAGARGPLERLGDRLGALLATSANGHGLFAGSPWSLGISGGFASPAAAELIGEADVVLAVGAALNMWTTRHGRLLRPDATVIQVDRAPEAIGAHHRVDLALVGDAGEAALALTEALERRGAPGAGWRSPAVAERIRRGTWRATLAPAAGGAPDPPAADRGAPSRIDPRVLSALLHDLVPAARTVAVDSGHFMGYPAMYLDVPDAEGFVFAQAFQAVGLGLASAIGAAVARPDRLTVAALGDGGALMALPELETVARLGLRLLIVVYNDAAYGAEVHHFGPHGHPLDLVRFPDVDLAALARAVGLTGATVRRPGDLGVVGAWLAGGATPALLLDAKVVPTVVAEWLEEAFRGH